MKTINTLLLGAALAALPLTASGQSWLTNGLVAYYPFNGNANDESGNGNNGSVLGASLAPDRRGNPDSAYYFAGDGSHIRLADKPWLHISDAITLTAWLRFEPG